MSDRRSRVGDFFKLSVFAGVPVLYLEDRSVTKKVPEGPRNTFDDVLDEWPASC